MARERGASASNKARNFFFGKKKQKTAQRCERSAAIQLP
jgi:hypothetical protein